MFELAERAKRIEPYLFARLEERIVEMRRSGVDVISLAIGDPDLPAPEFVRRALAEAALDAKNHNYPTSAGEPWFREAASAWMSRRFGVDADPSSEVCTLIGSKEGLANVARAFVGIGDTVLYPDPGYSVYANGATILCDGVQCPIRLEEEKSFLPDYDTIPKDILKKSKLLYLNYPNMPTGAIAPESFLKETAEFVERHGILLAYDNAYSEFTFDGYVSPSILKYTKNAIEFHSLSKTFCMTGDRLGFAVGDKEAITGLKKIKSNIDSGAPIYIQRAGVAALESYKNSLRPDEVEKNMREYKERRDVMLKGLEGIGFHPAKPEATFYIWLSIRETELTSAAFAEKALEKGVVITPGSGFGASGEGFVRFALTQPVSRIREALGRLEGIAAK